MDQKTLGTFAVMDMSAPADDSGNTYAHGMAAILSHLGSDVSYDRVMGLTGVAFILQVDTSGPRVNGELDCAWWPNDAWGFALGLPMLSQATGWPIEKWACDMLAYQADPASVYRQVFEPVVRQSLKSGKPVLAESVHGFVVTALDDAQPPLLGYGTRGKSTRYVPTPIRIDRYPWALFVIGQRMPVSDFRDVDQASLKHIIALCNEQAQGPDAPATRYSGKQAWAQWSKLLEADMAQGEPSHCTGAWDNNMLIHLRYNRRSAVAYLHDMADRHAGDIATHLTSAANLYQQALDALMDAEQPHPGPTKGGLPAYARMVEQVAGLEAQAVAQLQAAEARMASQKD